MAPKSTPAAPFAARVRQLRTARGLTRRQAADAAGLSYFTVHKVESGLHPNPRLGTLLALARGLGVDMNTLTEGCDVVPVPDE